FTEHYDYFLKEYQKLVRIPSVSTDVEHKADMQVACDFLADKLRALGAEHVEVFPTGVHPILFAEKRADAENAPTILIYGHYDVQPVNPIEEWHTPPFEPTVTGELMTARGASDMKGQVMAALAAVESVLASGPLPVNLKFLFEGEEEIGSPSLDGFIETHAELLACDIVLNPDAGMVSKDAPTIVYGLRGLLYLEVRVDGPKADLHSGLFGGNVANPANVLSAIIARLHNPDGSVAVPGFYDKVPPLSPEEKQRIASAHSDPAALLRITGVPQLYGEAGYSPLERTGARPTLDVNGLYSGFIGEGSKTIIPAYAKAKISCRLVPDQDPDEIYALLQAYISSLTPDAVRLTIVKHSGAPAYLADDAPGLAQLSKALSETWNKPVSFKREGGSIPVATTMQKYLGVKSLLTGFGLPDDQIHSPNEHQHLPTWKLGVQALIRFLLSDYHAN
ncbi:MAG: dipeptidase, partial [Anaerolineaceae bacterium]